ncbi:MAG TPA: TetR family transcriptional regulator, partial [Microthrixaceae bacterium]|nr:TetR family transcriptional regulator [Microthrixaceae bacterium]
MTLETGGARSELIDRLVEHAASNGLTDTSLRDLAAAVGTSHRMLNYHFGSRAGVVAAVVERIESQQRDALADLAAEATSTTEIVERQWAQLSDPALAP